MSNDEQVGYAASVTVQAGWCMGHRLPDHKGQCYNLHGHQYTAEVTYDGRIKHAPGSADDGMVIDFTSIKNRLKDVVRELDHRFLLYEKDPLVQHMSGMPGVFVVQFVPTAENIAVYIAARVPCDSVKVWETPTSFAVVRR